jgi:hypothetical protein
MDKIPAPAAAGLEVPFTFSQSSLQDYADCPRRFQLRYLERLVWPAVETEPVAETEIRQREGLQFHRMVQQLLLGVPAGRIAPMAASTDMARWWHNFVSRGPDVQGSSLSTEITLAAPVGQHRLVAKYDLVALQGRRAIVYDWKTYARRTRDEVLAARWQTRVYRALLIQAGSSLNGGRPFAPSDISMVYWFAEFPGEPATFNYDDVQFDRDWLAIRTLVEEISNATSFPLTEDTRQCRFCVYRSLCDRGDKAGLLAESEGAESEDGDFHLDFEQLNEVEF